MEGFNVAKSPQNCVQSVDVQLLQYLTICTMLSCIPTQAAIAPGAAQNSISEKKIDWILEKVTKILWNKDRVICVS